MSQRGLYKHYKSIDFLPMYCFYKAHDTGDLRYLLKLYDYEYLPDVDIDLSQVWEDINYQVADLDSQFNKKSEMIFGRRKKYELERLKYIRIKSILSSIRIKRNHELEKELAELGYKINPNNNFADEWLRINQQSENIKTKMASKAEDVKELMPKEGDKRDIQSTINDVERYLNTNIDPLKTSVKKWFIMLNKVVEESNQRQLKDGGRSK